MEQLSDLEASNSKETEKAAEYKAILLKATQSYFSQLNSLSVLKEDDIDLNKIQKIINICAEYEDVLEAIAYASNPDVYIKQMAAAVTLLIVMKEVICGALIGLYIYGILNSTLLGALNGATFVPTPLDVFIIVCIVPALTIAVEMILAPIYTARAAIQEKDLLASKADALKNDDVTEPVMRESRSRDFKNVFARSADQSCPPEYFRNVFGRNVFGDFGFFVEARKSGDLVASTLMINAFSHEQNLRFQQGMGYQTISSIRSLFSGESSSTVELETSGAAAAVKVS